MRNDVFLLRLISSNFTFRSHKYHVNSLQLVFYVRFFSIRQSTSKSAQVTVALHIYGDNYVAFNYTLLSASSQDCRQHARRNSGLSRLRANPNKINK